MREGQKERPGQRASLGAKAATFYSRIKLSYALSNGEEAWSAETKERAQGGCGKNGAVVNTAKGQLKTSKRRCRERAKKLSGLICMKIVPGGGTKKRNGEPGPTLVSTRGRKEHFWREGALLLADSAGR